MMKIVVGGQIDKEKIATTIRELAQEKISVQVMGDIEAAMAIKNGDADYYIGACNTGGGGALSMAIALLGMNNCATISMPGSIMNEQEIADQVTAGKKAFGFTAQHSDRVLPTLIQSLLNQ